VKNYKIKYNDKFSASQLRVIEEVVEQEMKLLLGYYQEREIVLEFRAFYVENEYLRFSAAADEPRRMWFTVNSFQPDMEGMIRNHLPECLAHEFHHMIRWNFIKEFHLAELMIMEGLAMHFVMELKGIEMPRYIHPVTDEIIEKLMPLIRRDLFNTDFDHRIWQKGSEEYGIPPSFAYSYGYKLVEEYFHKNPGVKASDCFDTDCREFFGILFGVH
jgi:Predicted Zn-dependent protease (DUF2268)